MVLKFLLCTTKAAPVTQKIAGVLGALCQELRSKTEYVSHCITIVCAQYVENQSDQTNLYHFDARCQRGFSHIDFSFPFVPMRGLDLIRRNDISPPWLFVLSVWVGGKQLVLCQ